MTQDFEMTAVTRPGMRPMLAVTLRHIVCDRLIATMKLDNTSGGGDLPGWLADGLLLQAGGHRCDAAQTTGAYFSPVAV